MVKEYTDVDGTLLQEGFYRRNNEEQMSYLTRLEDGTWFLETTLGAGEVSGRDKLVRCSDEDVDGRNIVLSSELKFIRRKRYEESRVKAQKLKKSIDELTTP